MSKNSYKFGRLSKTFFFQKPTAAPTGAPGAPSISEADIKKMVDDALTPIKSEIIILKSSLKQCTNKVELLENTCLNKETFNYFHDNDQKSFHSITYELCVMKFGEVDCNILYPEFG